MFEATIATSRPIADLTKGLLASYRDLGDINTTGGRRLPSRADIAAILHNLLHLLYPGILGDRIARLGLELELETTALVAMLHGHLEREIRKSLEHAKPDGVKDGDLEGLAESITGDALAQLPRLREILKTDIEAAFAGDPAALSPDEILAAYPFVEAISVQRFAHELYQRQVPIIPRIMTEWAHSRTGLDIHPGATIGTHFFVDHCTGTVIGETATIGNHVKMYQGVGLVARSLSAGQALRGHRRHPTIEDRVTLYANATIVGGDTVIGENSTIGAGVFILESVPPNSLVVFEPSGIRIRSKIRPEETIDYQI